MPITSKLQGFRHNVCAPEINHNLCSYFAGKETAKKGKLSKKAQLQGKLGFTHLLYFVLPITASTNKVAIKETSFGHGIDWTKAIVSCIVYSQHKNSWFSFSIT